jgi:large subunit ribosomal protein L10
MAISRVKKEEIVSKAGELLAKASAVFLLDFHGAKTAKVNQFRRTLKKLGAHYQVVKKTLARRAFENAKIDFAPLESHDGSLGMITANENELEIAKLLSNFRKENETIRVVGGFWNNEFLPAERVVFLAKIPSREVLLSQLAFVLSSPMRGIVTVLSGNIRSFVHTLKAIERSKT